MSNTNKVFAALFLVGIGLLVAANLLKCVPDEPGKRTIRAGDVVIHRLGTKGVITQCHSSYFGVRTERSGYWIEYWTPAEIDHIEE